MEPPRTTCASRSEAGSVPRGSRATDGEEPAGDESEPTPAWAIGARSATDHVRLFMEIVMGELRRPDHPRLVELEPGRWWLRDERTSRRPAVLSDRLEWAIFGLLSTSSGISEDAFFERVSRMYRGFDTPDEEMVRAILDSYRDPASPPTQLKPVTTCRAVMPSTARWSACSSNTGIAWACACGRDRASSAVPTVKAPWAIC
jgi:hypothetical protein